MSTSNPISPPSWARSEPRRLVRVGGRAMRARIKATWPGAAIAAPAFPVQCTPGDNLAIHVAVARWHRRAAHSSSTSGSSVELGYWGEVLTTAAQARGIAGLVIDGGVRDIEALERLRFPVFSAMVALRGATKDVAGHGRCARVGRRGPGGHGRLGRRRPRRRDRHPGRRDRHRARSGPGARGQGTRDVRPRCAPARRPSSCSASTRPPSNARNHRFRRQNSRHTHRFCRKNLGVQTTLGGVPPARTVATAEVASFAMLVRVACDPDPM